MRQRKRPLSFLIISILMLVGCLSLIYFIPPQFELVLLSFKFSIMPLFFFILFVFLFSLGTFIFNSHRHGLLIALFVPIYFIFRLNNLTHPFFVILLAALFLTVELLFSYRKE